jgi:hypothetical protein
VAWFEGRQADAAVDAGVGAGEELIRPRILGLRGEDEGTTREFEGAVDAFGEAWSDTGTEDKAVDDGFNGVETIGIEPWGIVEDVDDLAIDSCADEPFSTDRRESGLVMPFPVPNERREEEDFAALGRFEDLTDHLFGRLACDGAVALRAVGSAEAGISEPEMVEDFGDGADRGARAWGSSGALIDGDGRRQAVDFIDIRGLDLLQELASV